MTTLSDKNIKELINLGQLKIEPLIKDNIQPGSIDLTLGDEIDVFNFDGLVDIEAFPNTKAIKECFTSVNITNGFTLNPNQSVTGHSKEFLKLPQDINGLILNRNSLAMIGINAAISQYINPGFSGNKIIVLSNISSRPINIKAGLRICTLVLFKMGSESIRSYQNRHNEDCLKNLFTGYDTAKIKRENKNIDTSIADYMNMRIAELAKEK